jgi:hypothetical protein
MRNPFDEYRRVTIDIGIEQTLGSDVSLMPPSVAEPRFTDSVDHKSDSPGGIPADDDQEIEGPFSELIISRIRLVRTSQCIGLLKTVKQTAVRRIEHRGHAGRETNEH